MQAAEGERRNDEGRRAPDVGAGVDDRRHRRLLPRDHDDLEGRGDQHERQEQRQQRQFGRYRGIAHPAGDAVARDIQSGETQRADQRQRDERVRNRARPPQPACAARSSTGFRRCRAARRRRASCRSGTAVCKCRRRSAKHARQHDRNRKRHHPADHTAGDQAKRRPGNRIESQFEIHAACTRSHRRAGGHSRCA